MPAMGDGRTVAQVAETAGGRPHPCLRTLDDPFESDGGLVVLAGHSHAADRSSSVRRHRPTCGHTRVRPLSSMTIAPRSSVPLTPTCAPRQKRFSSFATPGRWAPLACLRLMSSRFRSACAKPVSTEMVCVTDGRRWHRVRRGRASCHPRGSNRWSYWPRSRWRRDPPRRPARHSRPARGRAGARPAPG